MTYLDQLVSVEPLGSEEDTTDVLGCTANERLNVEYPAPSGSATIWNWPETACSFTFSSNRRELERSAPSISPFSSRAYAVKEAPLPLRRTQN